jgi:N-acetylated-alpha-linked acidic dipeptidase
VTDTLIETYYPLLNYPNTTRLSILNSHYEANLDTDLFHAYSGNGNVTGSVVYVNYGRLTDFQFLATRGIQFNGTIALIRLGLINQGLKAKMAQDFGCIGVLLYQDPEEQETSAR